MEAFVWDERFVTGIPSVDAQHRHLVDIVNRVGDLLLAEGEGTDEALQQIFKQLADYAHLHFADEERLMTELGLDIRHQDLHVQHHRQFVEQLLSMWQARSSLSQPAETVHGFLVAWLTVHILGEDQVMARQMSRVQAGQSAAEAFAAESGEVADSTSALLDALGRLYHLVSQQNRDLAAMNQQLEAKVEERTRELSAANVRLAAEQAELARLLQKVESTQQQLLQSEKMAAIGQLAAGVAHEINNPVGFVHSNLGSLKQDIALLFKVIDTYEQYLPDSGPAFAALQQVREEADLAYLKSDLPALLAESDEGLARVTKIVKDLKDFSHVDEAELQTADLNKGMESTLNVVWNELKYKAEVVREYGDIPLVQCMPAQINQVFMNLLVNAAHAIPEHGTITVRSGREENGVWMEVQDTGKGMTPEVQKRIFEPFFTTKPVGKGTGLGLSLSYDIVVKKHGGRIEVRSAPGQGSTFRVSLPLEPAAAGAA